MRRATILLLAVAGAAGQASAQGVSDEERKEGFVALFNGKDFTGWRFDKGPGVGKQPDNWKVEGGRIKLAGGSRPHLASQWDYEDFDVRFEWRSVKSDYNSGFYIRSGRMVGANQINLAKGAPGGFIGGKIKGAKPVPALQKPPTEWNEWRVLAVGDTVTFWCNGKLAWKGTGLAQRRGYLGLQAEGFPMEFRNLRLKEIGYRALNDLKSWKDDGHWRGADDSLVSDGKKARLTSARADYKDYVLRLEWQGDKGATGGVALRGARSGRAVVRLGELAEGSGGLAGARPARQSDAPAGEWNYLEARVQAGKATVWLNGAVVVKDVDLNKAGAAESGGIDLLAEGAPLRFRNVRIREAAPAP
jgi:hypothetical protein